MGALLEVLLCLTPRKKWILTKNKNAKSYKPDVLCLARSATKIKRATHTQIESKRNYCCTIDYKIVSANERARVYREEPAFFFFKTHCVFTLQRSGAKQIFLFFPQENVHFFLS